MKRNQKESSVEEKTIEFLRQHYNKERKSNTKLYCKPQMGTTNGKIADGFFCFSNSTQEYYVVSVEAKSYKTLQDLTPNWNIKLLDRNALISAGLFMFISVLLTWTLSWIWIVVSVLLSGFIGLIGYYFYSGFFEPESHKQTSVINQIGQYPANEQWLAISNDSWKLLTKQDSVFQFSNDRVLKRACKKRGIGIIAVNFIGNAEVLLKPKVRPGKFLCCYAKSDLVISKMEEFKRQYN